MLATRQQVDSSTATKRKSSSKCLPIVQAMVYASLCLSLFHFPDYTFDPYASLLATLFGEQCVTKQWNKRAEQRRIENKATAIENSRKVECTGRQTERRQRLLCWLRPNTKCIFSSARSVFRSLLLCPVCWLFINVEMPLQIGVSFGCSATPEGGCLREGNTRANCVRVQV